MSQEPGVAFPQSTSTGGMKLEAVMEQLQRQQQARLEMERKERKLREAHIMYAQQVAAQQAILAAARASGAGFMGKALAGGIPSGGGLPPRVSNQSSVDSEREDDEDRGRDSGDEDDDTEMMEGDEGSDEDEGSNASRIPPRPFGSYAASAPQRAASPPIRVKQEPDEGLSPAGPNSATSPNGQADWSFDDHFRQLYELDNDPKRKEFLDDLFTFMQKRGMNPSQSYPIMAKQVLDLYMLYKLVTEKGGLVEVINKKIWREITKGLNLPTSITSAAFTLRTQYMKYLYPYECERKGLSSPGELQAAIDSNRREGRRPSYSSSLFRFSPSPSTAPHILSPPKMHLSALDDLTPSIMAARPSMALTLGQQQVAGLARAATLEQLREKLETSGGAEGPERKMARLAEEQQRLMQQAFQHNLLAMASQMPMNLRLGERRHVEQKLSICVDHNMEFVMFPFRPAGTLFAQKSGGAAGPAVSAAAAASASPAGTSTSFGFSAPPAQTLSPASSSSSSKGPGSAEPAPSGSP
uniref:AT-rich interactive domain-containing protein 3 n=1 Tax=Salarias fasciatus TaxID=181472 RepID=A0A672I1X5_SALFA